MKVYSNDSFDKSIRQRDFYLRVYVLPIAVFAVLAGLTYWLSTNNILLNRHTRYDFVAAIVLASLLYSANKRQWLRMPDGSYFYVKSIKVQSNTGRTEPAQYEAEFVYSKKGSALLLAAGLFLIIFAVLSTFDALLLPMMLVAAGIFFTYLGLSRILDHRPQLKIATTGLWTRKLGFVHWDDMNAALVVIDHGGRTTTQNLEVWLKGTKFEEANQPDESLIISNLANHEQIEILVATSISNHNRQQQQAGHITEPANADG